MRPSVPVLCLCLAPLPALAQPRPPAHPAPTMKARRALNTEPRVTVDFKAVPLKKALARLFPPTQSQYVIEADVPDVPVTLAAKDMPARLAIHRVIQQAAAREPRLSYSWEADLYRIYLRPLSQARRIDPDPVLSPQDMSTPVTLDLRDLPLRAALIQVARLARVQIDVAPDVPDVPVTMSIRDVPVQTSLRLLLRQASVPLGHNRSALVAVKVGDVYHVRINPAVP
jgi:hypothetical protein